MAPQITIDTIGLRQIPFTEDKGAICKTKTGFCGCCLRHQHQHAGAPFFLFLGTSPYHVPSNIKQKQKKLQTANSSMRACFMRYALVMSLPFYMDGHVSSPAIVHTHKTYRGPWLLVHPQAGRVLSFEFKVDIGYIAPASSAPQCPFSIAGH